MPNVEHSRIEESGKRKKRGGRQPGSKNKIPGGLKEAILEAAKKAGGQGGMVAYLQAQASANPGPFMALLGKVLPMQVTGENGGPMQVVVKQFTLADN